MPIAEEENFGQLRHRLAEFLYSARLDNSRKPTRLHNIDVAQSIPSPYVRALCRYAKRKSRLEGDVAEGGRAFRIEFHPFKPLKFLDAPLVYRP